MFQYLAMEVEAQVRRGGSRRGCEIAQGFRCRGLPASSDSEVFFQGEMVNRIENNIMEASDYVEKAKINTEKAVTYHQKARKVTVLCPLKVGGRGFITNPKQCLYILKRGPPLS